MDKEKIMMAIQKVKDALSELEAASSGMGADVERAEDVSGASDAEGKKSMIVAMMKKKMGQG